MPRIPELTALDTVTAGDLIPIYSQTNGDARKTSVSNLKTFVQGGDTANDFQRQAIAVGVSGFSVQVTDSAVNTFLILQGTVALASGTIVFPLNTNATDGQEIMIFSLRQVNAITFNGNGAANVYGAPSSLAAEDSVRFRYDSTTNSWYGVT